MKWLKDNVAWIVICVGFLSTWIIIPYRVSENEKCCTDATEQVKKIAVIENELEDINEKVRVLFNITVKKH